jgi:hypothetical protein
MKLIIVGLLLAACAFGQRDLATISGTVTDPQGGAISNAKVVITEDATALSYEVTTNAAGEFVRPALKPGIYSVTAEVPGFKKGTQRGVEATAGGRVAVPMTLEIGEVTQSVEITAAAPLLQTETTVLGQNLSSQQTGELPLGGTRVFSFLARLSPGVVPGEAGARDEAGGSFSANGVRSNGQNNFLLNGVDNNVNVIDFLNQAAYVVGPSVEAIGEMSVLTNGYNAEYGRGAGGVVNVSIKSGTNELHGSVFEYLQNEDLNANTWENNKNGAARGAYKQNQFGAAIGGPILKNRLFMFGDYQGTRIASNSQALNLGIGGTMTIPTPAMIGGDFSQLLTNNVLGTDALGRNVYQGAIYDPATTRTVNGQLVRDPFPNNQIPIAQMDPAALKIAQLFPHPNTNYVTSGGTPLNDYFIVTPVPLNIDQGDGRVDYRATEKDTIFGSLSWSDKSQTNGQPLPGALDATYFASQSEEDLARNAMLSWTRVWNPHLISETRVAYTRLVTSRVQADPNTDQFAAFGIGGYNPTTTLNGGLPSTSFNRVGNGLYSGIGASDWLPSKEYNNVWDFIENVSIMTGSHALKFGAEYRPIGFPFFQVPSPHGNWQFDNRSTAAPIAGNIANNTGDPIASFLLGQVYYGQISTNNFISSQKWAWAFFGQDDWKVNSKLTLNLGLRYEIFSPIGEKFGRQSNFDYPNLTLDIPSGKDQNTPLPPSFDPGGKLSFINVTRGQVDKYLIPTDYLDFSPRIGLAYQLRQRTVIRAGYGVFYGGEENQGGYPNRGEAVPFNETVYLDRTPLGSGAGNTFLPNTYFQSTNGVSAGFPSDVFSLDVPPAFRGITTNFRNPIVHKWNVAVQQDLGHNMAVEVSYVGNHQAHSVRIWDANDCPNSPDPNYNCDANRPVPAVGSISYVDSFDFGNYHGMTAKVEKRYSNGLSFLSSYTYGHALANGGTTLTGSTNQNSKDRRNLADGYSSAAWDIRHSLVTSFIYDLPFGKGRKYLTSGPGAYVLGGWQANGVLTFRTGPPFTLTTNQCVGTFGTCQPDVVSGKDPKNAPSGGRRAEEWFDTSAVVAPAPGTPGNLGLQSQNEPGQRQVDFSLFKDIPFTERFKLQFRAEAFNIANTPQWGRLSGDATTQGNSSFGQITSTQPNTQRHVQFALRFIF